MCDEGYRSAASLRGWILKLEMFKTDLEVRARGMEMVDNGGLSRWTLKIRGFRSSATRGHQKSFGSFTGM